MDMSLTYTMDLRKSASRDARPKSPSPNSPTPEFLETPPNRSSPPYHLPPRFHHNPLHDLESMFWIAAYFLFKAAGKGAEAAVIERQQNATRELFYDTLERCFCIQDNVHFIRSLRSLHQSVQPAGHCLDAWRSELGGAFYTAEKDCLHITCAVAAELHESLSHALLRIAKLMAESPVHLPPQNRKRMFQDVGDSSQSEDGDGPTRIEKRARTLDQTSETKK